MEKKYAEKDFPEHGNFNWKTVKLKTPDKPYYDRHKVMGVVLHDGNFITNGVLFLEDQYEIIDHLCQMSDDQTKAFEQYIHRDTRPMVMS